MKVTTQQAEDSKAKHKRYLIRLGVCCAIGLSLALGVFLRIEDLIVWREKPEMAFYKGVPLLTTFDGFHYARLARDLVEGNYKPLDELRCVPKSPARPLPPPLLSLTLAGIVKLTGASIDWVCTLFPPVFGVLLFFPVFLIGRLWGNTFTGITAGLLSLVSPYYVNRSRLGWLDTDCGNVTFTMLAAYLAIRCVTTEGRRQLYYLGGVLINFVAYLFWWDSTPPVVVATCLGSLLLSWVSEKKSFRRNLFPVAAATLIIGVIMICFQGLEFWHNLFHHLLGQFKYISKASPGDFPNIGLSISEQAKIPFEGVVEISAGNWFLFTAAALGAVLLFVGSPSRGLQLLVPLGLGGLTFFYARRFGIFLAPFLGLGIGHLLFWLKEQVLNRSPRTLWKSLHIAGWLAIPVGIGHLVLINVGTTFWPVEPPSIIKGMDLARQKTPPDSLIWAWWDHGYPIHYWGRRGTISDGAYHDGELAMINAFAMVSPDYRLSANWMHFYATRGIDGFHRVYSQLGGASKGLDFIREVLVAGPEKALGVITRYGLKPEEQWLQFFYPPLDQRRKLFLFLDERLVGTSYWWYWLGSWDIEEQNGVRPILHFFVQVKQEGDQLLGKPPFAVDLKQGIFSAAKTSMPLAMVVVRQGEQWQEMQYRDVGMIFEHDPQSAWGTLCSPEIYESLFNKLFFLGMADIRFFKPVFLSTGIVQLWEVLGDLPGHPASAPR